MRRVDFASQAIKATRKLDAKNPPVAKLISFQIQELRKNPESPNSKRLVNCQ